MGKRATAQSRLRPVGGGAGKGGVGGVGGGGKRGQGKPEALGRSHCNLFLYARRLWIKLIQITCSSQVPYHSRKKVLPPILRRKMIPLRGGILKHEPWLTKKFKRPVIGFIDSTSSY